MAAVSGATPDGEYTLTWSAMSQNGIQQTGTIRFTLARGSSERYESPRHLAVVLYDGRKDECVWAHCVTRTLFAPCPTEKAHVQLPR